ncbi:SLATT domain-containing protein [Streptomyces sp. TP-A0874]|uniref:SLATT domain-containing protein n=1 Tax=Streptomyces sp. TP-A0874 TaxID=549819 RepID=UPI000852A964|nr:SLATT domain-containing protein [Streptomyces sp. TP-A0874]
MSQSETQPEGPREDAGRKHGDLLGQPIPLGDWAEPAERLDELYRWVEERALYTVDWYLADRRWKRRTARILRVGAAVSAATGVLLPMLDLAGVLGGGAAWGYLALLGAAVCAGSDRFFGLTSGWMREIATAQAVQRRLEALQFDWASESVREVLGPTEGTASEAAERCLSVLRRFSEDVTDLVRAETADWMVEFRSGSAPLRIQALVPWGPRTQGTQPVTRLPLPPGARPNMPRQRPPEPPR